MKEKCVPVGDDGKGQGRGQGEGPMGVPTKEQNVMNKSDILVDEILDGNYKQVKVVEAAMDMVDIILDMDLTEGSGYQEYFKGMLQKFGVNSPTELQGEKKKQFFAAVSKGWKGKKKVSEGIVGSMAVTMGISAAAGLTATAIAKRAVYCKEKHKDDPKERKRCLFLWANKKKEKKVSEVANAIDHVPDEDSDEIISNIEDELGSEERDRKQLERKGFNEKDLIENAFNEVIEERALINKAYKEVQKEL